MFAPHVRWIVGYRVLACLTTGLYILALLGWSYVLAWNLSICRALDIDIYTWIVILFFFWSRLEREPTRLAGFEEVRETDEQWIDNTIDCSYLTLLKLWCFVKSNESESEGKASGKRVRLLLWVNTTTQAKDASFEQNNSSVAKHRDQIRS